MSSLSASHFWQSVANLLVVHPRDVFFAVEHPLRPRGAVGDADRHRAPCGDAHVLGRGLELAAESWSSSKWDAEPLELQGNLITSGRHNS